MDFRLIYQGRLPSETSKPHPKVKHEIRRVFHKQLAELWHRSPLLHYQVHQPLKIYTTPSTMVSYPGPNKLTAQWATPGEPETKTWLEHLTEQYQRHGFRFVPLVRKDADVHCGLDILFLRRDVPGNFVKFGGDIDNRLKVLFDSLRIVDSASELGGATPQTGEDPFFCLLEDDRLITEIKVVTDQLLTPTEPVEAVNDVLLVIHVTLTDPTGPFSAGRLV